MCRIAVALTSLSTACLLTTTMFFSPGAQAAEYNPARTRPKAEAQATAQRVIVKFRQSSGLSIQNTNNGESANSTAVTTARMNALAGRARIAVHGSRALSANMQAMVISPLTNNETAAETLARLRADSDVEMAELDHRVYPHATSNDPLATNQWFLKAAQPSATNANGAWDTTMGGNGVVIAVIDTGVRFDHPDLLRASSGGKFLPGYDFVSPDSGNSFKTANDGDGRDADASDPGDWVASSDNCGTPGDSSWHGTRVSGIIGALTNNSAGVAGYLWNGYILPVRVLGKCGGYNSDVLAGMRWAAGLSVPGVPTNPYPARVINVSLGSEGACDSASANVIAEVTAAGVLVVVSAGNEGGPVDSPANCPGAMAVLGLRHAGTKVGFSSLGPEIALGAPGGNCVNIDGGPCLFSIDTTSNAGATTPGANNYTDQVNFNVGTSFSSPIVAGVAGLMLAVNGNLKSSQLIARMQEGATKPFPTTSDSGSVPVCHLPTGRFDIQNTECICTTAVCGAGMANANGAVAAASRPIAAILPPTTVSAGQNVTLQGSGSAAACNRTISSYAWTVLPPSTATLTNANTPTATLLAPTSGSVVVRLTVTDDVGKIDSADVTVTPTSATVTGPTSAGTNACLASIAPPAAVSITASDPTAAEAATDPGIFTLTRTGSTTAALAVTLSLSGTATSGTDYQAVSTTVTIPAGQASTTITVTPIDDSIVEAAETVIATVQTGAGYEPGTSSSATITIADNDTSAPPPNDGGGGGGGGGGALDMLTLMLGVSLLIHAQLHRKKRRLRAVL